MKKIILMLAVAIAAASCSSDEGGVSGPTAGVILPKKIIETDADGLSTTSNYTYNGTKLDKVTTSDGVTIDINYSGEFISEVVYKFGSTVINRELYTYDNQGRVSEYVYLDYDFEEGSRETYTYGSGNAVVTEYFGTLTSQNELSGSYTMVFTNGEVTSKQINGGTITYTYDNKNNPFMNVTGYSKIAYTGGTIDGIMHNVLTETGLFGTRTTAHTYLPNNYPSVSVTTGPFDDWTSAYEYYE